MKVYKKYYSLLIYYNLKHLLVNQSINNLKPKEKNENFNKKLRK